jgi:transketolase
MPLEDFRAKWEAFGWHVLEINGNDIEAVVDACAEARAVENKPVMIIAHTIPGKGVDFMEYDFAWHGKPPNHDEAKKALHELRTLGGKIRGEHE